MHKCAHTDRQRERDRCDFIHVCLILTHPVKLAISLFSMIDVLLSGIYAFITLKENVAKSTTDIITDLRVLVKNNIASYAIPDIIQVWRLLIR